MYKLDFMYLVFVLLAFVLTNCNSYKRSIKEEVILKNGNSETGRIITSDSTQLKIKKADASVSVIQWEDIDKIRGIKLFSPALSINGGLYFNPYFSVFRNENYYPTNGGAAIRAGMVKYGKRFRYFNLVIIPARPYSIAKTGYGFQRYFRRDYLNNWNIHAGSEFNLMHIRYNNAPQFCIEPFAGAEIKWTENLRCNAKFGIMACPFSKSDRMGVNFSFGINYIMVDFKKRYDTLMQNREL